MIEQSVARKASGQATVDQRPLSNQEIVTLAVYFLGGSSSPVDTEDVAVRANELAPGRFAWRKYPGQINIDTVRKRLWDAARPGRPGFLAGTERLGWTLTARGLKFVEAATSADQGFSFSKERLTLKERQWRAAERRRLLASDAYEAFQRRGASAISQRLAEAFFRLDDYVVGQMRQRKVQRIANAFADDPELGAVVRLLAAKVRTTHATA